MKSITISNSSVNLYNNFDSAAISRTFSPNRKLDVKKFEWDGTGKYYRDGWLNIKYSKDANQYQHIVPEFQFPHALGLSNNLYCQQTEHDIAEALGMVNERVSSLIGIEFDISAKGKVIYIDANRDFSVPNKSEYLEFLKRLEVQRMTKHPYKTGVMFENQGTKIKCYDKFEQLEIKHRELPEYIRDFAQTLFRLETRKQDDGLRRFLQAIYESTEKTAGKILTPDLAQKIVDVSLALLQMHGDLMSFLEWRNSVRDNFKAAQAARLIEFVEKINRVGIKRVRGKSKSSINRFNYLRKCLSAEGLGQLVFANESLIALNEFPNDDWSMYW